MFGMGTGVTPPVRSPETFKSRCQVFGVRYRGRTAELKNNSALPWNLKPDTWSLLF